MGGAVSSGKDNNELVDNLLESGYIKTKQVEQVFRAVDRAEYILHSHRESAYKDMAWKHGNIHLSAPCVYSEAMEGLSLAPGLSFLNLGSGTGYLSTMAGLILKQNGINHGIELHQDCVKYSYDRLEEFKREASALDEFDFCEPVFVQGNCLSVTPSRQYDRVYCGAACPESHETFVKQFVKVGGILVMPYKANLLRIERIDEITWMHKTMLPVSFATLVLPSAAEQNSYQLPDCHPLSLQEICRGRIRRRLRENVWLERSDVETRKPVTHNRLTQSPPQRTRCYDIPVFEESDEGLSDEDDDFIDRAQLLLNVDAHSRESIVTTLQLVRAAFQNTRDEIHDDWQVQIRGSANINHYHVETVNLNSDNNQESRLEQVEEPERPQNSADAHRNTESSSDATSTRSSAGTQQQRQRQRQRQQERQDSAARARVKYSQKNCAISDSDNDIEEDNAPLQCKKPAKHAKSDSGILEDVNVPNENGGLSSPTNQSDSDVADGTDTSDAMDVDLSDITTSKSFKRLYNSHSTSTNSTPSEDTIYAHYIDSNAFTSYMKEKIHQLPLPLSLKLYINYNRNL
ncbi:protein-L-isoaspartate O-methyltransferase domain-containing protein 1 [Cephus cinctus]|uniref:Protein-L-isoaspartate O-methyltransferase domain-containing protein 1 n=1 Tax=Cephus cinctus TaxID=211228 RepID=A0AAJ7C9E1_CEPCN|nr:protein-L-isoaspartate O-methyltransferase domain-containing protein 1 [Cephus cinctus]XP_015605221.1 protein-L-isoaspartate O-methyltransferase domain-containing protein 1 [Cephus cinctus]